MTKPKKLVHSVFTSQGYKNGYAAGLIAGEQGLIQTLIRLLKKDYFKYFVRSDMIDWLSASTKTVKK